jgi:flavin reductase (DIM6/NTAB) family NADH-FMN oxidoreductase RutF
MPPLDPARFLAAMAELPAGVTVTTCRDADGAPVGATLSAVTSLSLDPPMVLTCFDRGSNTLKAVVEPGTAFLLHILAHGQEAIAMAFAGKSGNKFADVDWAPGRLGLPRIAGCAATLLCRVADLVPGGDHMIVTAHVVESHVADDPLPLVYHRRRLAPVPAAA